MPAKRRLVEPKPTPVAPLSPVIYADDADVIIHAEGVDFHVHQAFLSLASRFFKDTFADPQSPSVIPGPMPRVDVRESSVVWNNILQTIYPMANPIIDNIDDLESLLLTAKRYQMPSVINSHKHTIQRYDLIKEDPLRLYSVACSCGASEEAKFVAKNADILTVVRSAEGDGPSGLTLAFYRRLITFLVERDNEFNQVLEVEWAKFAGVCFCAMGKNELYKTARAELRKPYIQREEAYLTALRDRSEFGQQTCGKSWCKMVAENIDKLLGNIFQKREAVRSKFMWE